MAQSVKFYRYYERWMKLYKKGAVQPVTYQKYQITQQQLTKLAPELRMKELSRLTYQQLLNDYASNHERQTVMDFHHHLKSALLDAIDDGLLKRDPTRKAVIKGIIQRKHKVKFLNQKETQALLNGLDLGTEINWDYFILLIAKTGLRFAEALGLTPDDFDFAHHRLDINKTWNYKERQGGFALTKNSSSVRKVELDWQTVMQFSQLIKNLPNDQPIFVKGRIHNDTVNHYLERLCNKAEVPVISIHGLRHTHASLLLYAGVSTASVARRLGHANITTTQKTYLHIIKELENEDNDKVMRHLANLM